MPRTVSQRKTSSKRTGTSKRTRTALAPYGTPPRVRLLPITIASLSLLLTAKLVDIYERGNAFSDMMLGRAAYAEDAPVDEEAAQPKDAEKKEEVASKEGKAPTEDKNTEDKGTAKESKNTKTESPSKEPKENDMQVASNDARQFSNIELDILQSLSKRRDELEKMEKEVKLKEHLLGSTEVRLNEKISQIQTMEKTLRDLLGKYDDQEAAKIRSLVKIYENMKPKEAARIFDEMQMPILLMVVDKMSERRAAPILAKMSPVKAKDLTQELAEDRAWRDQQEQQLNNIAQ
ncbi:MAG: hypothetical protein EAZ74_01800 [Alphaproteobacteria bacterium]|nr:MAG: hypothetical protein EAY76_01845 [Alphaproteobacteria bacterium]TAF15424.1 MAG: hypothetical protein EAZ74_01800 [Alphaproteobacteria bacterium]TAF75682.1 MAG: hypothetical protein EAZ52_06400 [Alphaproteobacteria bacterium]